MAFHLKYWISSLHFLQYRETKAMKGFRGTTVVVVAAFLLSLLVSGFAAPRDECSEHQLIADAAINDAVLALVKSDCFIEDFESEELSWGPFFSTVTSWHYHIENAFQPFIRYCEEGDAMVDAELEFAWVASGECYIRPIEKSLPNVHVILSQAVAKVRFQLSMFPGNESFTLRHVSSRVTWPGIVSASVYSNAAGYYGELVNVLASLLAKFYASDILNWNWARSAITNVFVDAAKKVGPFYVEP